MDNVKITINGCVATGVKPAAAPEGMSFKIEHEIDSDLLGSETIYQEIRNHIVTELEDRVGILLGNAIKATALERSQGLGAAQGEEAEPDGPEEPEDPEEEE